MEASQRLEAATNNPLASTRKNPNQNKISPAAPRNTMGAQIRQLDLTHQCIQCTLFDFGQRQLRKTGHRQCVDVVAYTLLEVAAPLD